MKKTIRLFFTFLIFIFFALSLEAETRQPEIVELGEGVLVHAIVKEIILSNNINIQDVIDAYKSAMSKEENKDLLTIIGKHKNFSIYIEPGDKTIFSIAIRHKKDEL